MAKKKPVIDYLVVVRHHAAHMFSFPTKRARKEFLDELPDDVEYCTADFERGAQSDGKKSRPTHREVSQSVCAACKELCPDDEVVMIAGHLLCEGCAEVADLLSGDDPHGRGWRV
jgi:Pyruvate/2-oxoacid:ferredoxin oxidoreductase delta subunit